MPAYTLKVPPAAPGMAIGLMGGTFDPPHAGHLHISEMALKRLGLDRLWWLVTPGNPLKTRADMASFDDRLAAAGETARHARIDVTGLEATAGSAYTADTVRFLVTRCPGVHFVWVMGADNLAGFHHWARWRDIVRAVPVAVIDRPGYRFAALGSRAARFFANAYVDESDALGLKYLFPPAWTLLTVPLSPLSSTELRAGESK